MRKLVLAVLVLACLAAQAWAQPATPMPLIGGTPYSAASMGRLAPPPTPAPVPAHTPIALLLLASDCRPTGDTSDAPDWRSRDGKVLAPIAKGDVVQVSVAWRGMNGAISELVAVPTGVTLPTLIAVVKGTPYSVTGASAIQVETDTAGVGLRLSQRRAPARYLRLPAIG